MIVSMNKAGAPRKPQLGKSNRGLYNCGYTRNPTFVALRQFSKKRGISGPIPPLNQSMSMIPRRIAVTSACVRSETPSFEKMLTM